MSSSPSRWSRWLHALVSPFRQEWVTPENALVRRVYAGPVRLPRFPVPAAIGDAPVVTAAQEPAPASQPPPRSTFDRTAPVAAPPVVEEPAAPEKQPIPFPGRAA